jgi:hypothetical protein
MSKYKLLFLSLLIDAGGMLTSSWVLPLLGDFADIIWAPFTAWLMTRLYKGNAGKIAGVATFIEEIIPGLDIIPSFTLMWLYTHVFSSSRFSDERDTNVIDIEEEK